MFKRTKIVKQYSMRSDSYRYSVYYRKWIFRIIPIWDLVGAYEDLESAKSTAINISQKLHYAERDQTIGYY